MTSSITTYTAWMVESDWHEYQPLYIFSRTKSTFNNLTADNVKIILKSWKIPIYYPAVLPVSWFSSWVAKIVTFTSEDFVHYELNMARWGLNTFVYMNLNLLEKPLWIDFTFYVSLWVYTSERRSNITGSFHNFRSTSGEPSYLP